MIESQRFLLVVFSDSGHLNPMIAVAQHLERAGHEVLIFSLQEDVAERCRLAGLRARCGCRGVAAVAGARPEAQRSIKLTKRLANPAWVKRWSAAILLEQVPAQVAALRPFVHDARPDVVVADSMGYAAPVVAELEGIPWVSVATGLQSMLGAGEDAPSAAVYRDLAPARDEMLASLGVTLRFDGSDALSPRLNTVFAIEGLVPTTSRTDLRLVGPALPLEHRGDERPFPFERLPVDRPIVYVSFGSFLSPVPEVYGAIVTALSAEEAFFVVTVKDLIDEPFVRAFPSHVLAVEYAPQLAVLERAAVMVNHGGANSVHECLSKGKPMVVVPLAYDQALFARLVVEAGVGASLDSATMTTEKCRAVLLPLLRADASERVRAAELAARCGNGAARLAELLATVVS